MKQNNSLSLVLLLVSMLFVSCSMTKDIPEGDKLFIGLTDLSYDNYEPGSNFDEAQVEVEAALATAPNGSILGSSKYRVPFSFGVTVWNKYANKDSGFARWMTKTFGKQPVLMSWINPELRSQVARNVLRNYGYFQAEVGYDEIPQRNPKTMKVMYSVLPGRVYTYDSISYIGFPPVADSLIHHSLDQAYVHRGDPFNVSRLDAERQRISLLLRNQGYYYYKPDLASYLADTFMVDGKVQLRFQLAKEVPQVAKRQWYIGRININMRKTMLAQYTDSMKGRVFTIRYSGKKPPIRPRILMADLKLRPRQLYTYQNYLESINKINAMGLFSSTEFVFTPRDTSLLAHNDTLDLTLNCTFAQPWDFYVETNFNARTIGRMGPELKLGVTRRNAFRGAEKIDVNLHGSYEWATSGGTSMSNYEYGVDASVTFPRIIAPFFGGNRIRRDKNGRIIRRIRYATPTTTAKVSTNIIHRPSFYKMHVASGEWTYNWQPSATSRHEFSPLFVKYQFMNSHTASFDSVMAANPYLKSTMQDHFIPEISYTYIYNSPSNFMNPIRWETTIAESGNVTSLLMMAAGKKWDDVGKQLFKNPYSQFLCLATDFTKTWTLSEVAKIVGHVNAGVIYAYGNSNSVPNSERFYAGGANSVRAFSVRGIGPGRFAGFKNQTNSYLFRNGDIKLVCNLEYRRQLFGNLHGAVFLDAGNVWNFKEDTSTNSEGLSMTNTKFRISRLLNDLALGVGVGLRYDLDFLILRVDWGMALHLPYETTRSGYFNNDGFKHNQTLHFAIGYPF